MRHRRQRLHRLFSLIGSFRRHRRELGIKAALTNTALYLGMRRFVFLPIRYPVTETPVKVSGNPYFWKALERADWELNYIKHISNVVKEGQTILDVGAWIGPYTLLFGRLVKDTGQVYAFEPDPAARRTLRRNVRKNGLTNVRTQEFAVSNAKGESRLQSYGKWGDQEASLIGRQSDIGKTPKQITVKTTSIDDFCKEYALRPDGIKIDVEGAEAMVIEGCRNTIKENSPWVLLEFHGQFMSEEERRINWHSIVDSAKKVTFIAGSSSRYSYGSEVTSMPDCPYCHVFIEY